MDFIKLLERAGITFLIEAMTPVQAAAIFKQYGATDDDLSSPEKLKSVRKKLIMAHHSDLTSGNDEAAKLINASYDVLKNLSNGYNASNNTSSHPFSSKPAYAGVSPDWQTDPRGSSNIGIENYMDVNYFKKRMWELSNHSHKKYTIWVFDGYFFRGTVTVFGSPKIFDDMANAMVIWNGSGNPYSTRAVFVQEEHTPTLFLIYLDKKMIKPPIEMEHDSFNRNPGNDQQFVRKLPGILDNITNNR